MTFDPPARGSEFSIKKGEMPSPAAGSELHSSIRDTDARKIAIPRSRSRRVRARTRAPSERALHQSI